MCSLVKAGLSESWKKSEHYRTITHGKKSCLAHKRGICGVWAACRQKRSPFWFGRPGGILTRSWEMGGIGLCGDESNNDWCPQKESSMNKSTELGELTSCMPRMSRVMECWKEWVSYWLPKEVNLAQSQDRMHMTLNCCTKQRQNSSRDTGFWFWRLKSGTRAISSHMK